MVVRQPPPPTQPLASQPPPNSTTDFTFYNNSGTTVRTGYPVNPSKLNSGARIMSQSPDTTLMGDESGPKTTARRRRVPVDTSLDEISGDGSGSSRHRSISPLSDEDSNLLGGEPPRDYVMGEDGAVEENSEPEGRKLEEALGPLISGSRDQRLTLMDEVVLLGLKDKQGYLSFLNDSISYVLRGCIIMELALRRRIRIFREPGTSKRPFPDRLIEVVDSSTTGEVLLDEALRLMRNERNSIASWIDLLSGETWNPLKVGYQLKQVRERIAKGLVDKGVLRTEKHSFLLFDMATHPLNNGVVKEEVIRRTVTTCLGRGPVPTLRAIVLVTSSLTANVLENALARLPMTERDSAFNRAEELLRVYSNPVERHVSLPIPNEIIAGVLTVFSRLDSLIY